jgi:hypothetical protein
MRKERKHYTAEEKVAILRRDMFGAIMTGEGARKQYAILYCYAPTSCIDDRSHLCM